MSIGHKPPSSTIEGEVVVERGNEASLEFEVGRLEAEVGLDAPKQGLVELSFEAGGKEWEFLFKPQDGFEKTFIAKVKGREYVVELEAGRGDEPGESEAEAEIKPGAPTREVELELEVDRGDSGEGSLEVKGVEIGLEAEAVGKKYLIEVELENEKTGKSVEREFLVNPEKAFEKEFELALGGKVFELELETELDRKEDEFSVSLEVEPADQDHIASSAEYLL
jgi:hypothetical protein